MPLYEYECKQCGGFDAFRPLSKAGDACDCPACGASAPRAFSVPRVRGMSALGLMAAERNEKSRHAPHVCRSGCGCSGKPKSNSSKPTRGKQRYQGPRPWVIEHA